VLSTSPDRARPTRSFRLRGNWSLSSCSPVSHRYSASTRATAAWLTVPLRTRPALCSQRRRYGPCSVSRSQRYLPASLVPSASRPLRGRPIGCTSPPWTGGATVLRHMPSMFKGLSACQGGGAVGAASDEVEVGMSYLHLLWSRSRVHPPWHRPVPRQAAPPSRCGWDYELPFRREYEAV
jgi:hypothetical protein